MGETLLVRRGSEGIECGEEFGQELRQPANITPGEDSTIQEQTARKNF